MLTAFNCSILAHRNSRVTNTLRLSLGAFCQSDTPSPSCTSLQMLTPLQLGQAAHAFTIVCLAVAQEQLRAQAAREEAEQPALKRMRRNGWHPKPRNYVLYGRSEEGSDAWEHNADRSSLWVYINAPSNEPYYNSLFKKAIGIERWMYEYYIDLVKAVHGLGEENQDHLKHGRRKPQPLAMKICSWALVLTKGCSFSDAAIVCCISDTVVRRFFHKMNNWLVCNEYSKHVYPPTIEAEVAKVEKKFALMGFPGAITCIDATHVAWLNCPAADSWRNSGKDGFPTRSFNCAVGPSREFHHIHASHPGAHNDKTISRFDQFMLAIRSGKLYGSFKFLLRSSASETQEWKGLYAITDGGYHAWRCLQYPNKKSARWDIMRWSKRCESVRKVSECAFGILKQRFRLLRIGIPFKCASSKTTSIDATFMVCAMLHNQILRQRKYHIVGDLPDHWRSASMELDDSRIKAELDNQCRGSHAGGLSGKLVDDEAVGNETQQEVEGGHATLFDALVQHYALQWEDKAILWPKGMVEICGHVDHRPLEFAGGSGLHQGEYRHALVSENESSEEGEED